MGALFLVCGLLARFIGEKNEKMAKSFVADFKG